MKVVPQPWGGSKGVGWLFSAGSDAPYPPPPTLGCSDRRLLRAFQGDVQINDVKGKARRHSGLKEGHHRLNGGRTIRLLKITFINGSGEEATSHLQRRSNLQVPR